MKRVENKVVIDAVAELRASEEKYRSLIGKVQTAIVLHDGRGRILDSNPLAQELLGFSADQLLGKALIDLEWRFLRENGSVLPVAEYPASVVLSTRQPLRGYVAGISRPDRDEIAWVLINAEPECDSAGEITRIIVYFMDITVRKRMEEERKAHLRFFESMDRINRAIQANNDLEQMMGDVLDVVLAVFDCDRAFLLHPCSPEAPTWGVPKERTKPEYPGVLALGIEVPMTPDVAETLRILLASDGPVKFGPGTPHPLPADASERFGFKCLMSMALRPKAGKAWQFGIHQCSYARIWTAEEERLFQEIGRRLADGLTGLLAYRDVRESEDRYRRITECLTDYQYSVRVEDGRAVATIQSPACAAVTGYSAPEFAADPYLWIRMVAPEDRDQVRYRVQQILAGKELPPLEHRILRKDGAVRWVCDTIILLKDASGQLLSYDGVIKDITERKQAEEEIHRLNHELDQRVRERTAQLEAANKELESFAYSVAHDLRAPLRAIDGFSQALLDDCSAKLDEEGKRHLQRVRAAAQRMGHLIDDMLSLSRVTRGDLRMAPVDLSGLAREIADELARRDPERQVIVAIAPELAVNGDACLLRVVMENLLGNAWKFTSKCSEARIEFGVTEREGRPVYFVRDNGAGFDMEYTGKLFGAFQRLHAADEFPGTGIGLATVQRILQRHGGRVWAEGRVNQGATFYFVFYRSRSEVYDGSIDEQNKAPNAPQ